MNEIRLISIIIPTYNSGKTIEACLESISIQTFKAFEVIIIDGLSTDETILNAKEFENKIALTISSAMDEGIYDAMNKGISLAKGEYLYFLGSDDTLFDNEVLHTIAKEIVNSDARIIYGNVKMKGNSHLVKNNTIYGGEFDLKRLLVHNIPHQAIFYHKSVFDQIGKYNINYQLFADHDFNLRAISKFELQYIDQIVANFNVGGSSTTLKDEKFEQDKIYNFINYFGKHIHKIEFAKVRYYIKEAALNRNSKVAPMMRVYCLMIYSKLKVQSLLK
ncbi:glycosyltransferase [Pedobacter changchengzhani]|uniref:Glycosyltransferase n=1 Tax=Pedobacter changchengzhani TaxID=2529274 RepID=A0A4V2ZZY4_9SPHI|nr:glycosyltransferase family 2 protein [Pedobacter changchengzhani]TDG35303.1 glycosyltransferase [Pedobacter changchengzhani]